VLGSPDSGKEFLVRACGILVHGDAVFVQEAAGGDGPAMALPGGHLEFGETLAACLSREFFEECGLNVEAEKLVYVHENFYTVTKIARRRIPRATSRAGKPTSGCVSSPSRRFGLPH